MIWTAGIMLVWLLYASMRNVSVITAVFGIVFALAGCSSMTTEEKYAHLRDVANKGADAHYVLINENKLTNREECEKHFSVFVPDGTPLEHGFATDNSVEWRELSKAYFADSCVSGTPREIKTRPTSNAPTVITTPPATETSAAIAK